MLPKDTYTSTLAWVSGKASVAMVDETGLVTALKPGKVRIAVKTGNGKRAICALTVTPAPLPPIEPTRGKLLRRVYTRSLKVSCVYDAGIYLTYVWVREPARQLFKQYGSAKPDQLLKDAVKSNGLKNKLAVGFNASPPVNSQYYTSWYRDKTYKYREPSPLMIRNGEVLARDPKKSIALNLYWLDGSGQLRYSDAMISQMTRDERDALYGEIIASGACNTMIWWPVLVADHAAVKLSASLLKKESAARRKQAFCQLDDHNFLIASSANAKKGYRTYPAFQKYLVELGCRTAVELDAGGSTTLLYKAPGTEKVTKLCGGERALTMVMYFTEL